MLVDKTRLNKIGIDRIVINNFKILNFDKLEKKQVTSKLECVQKLEKKTDLYNLTYSVATHEKEELYITSNLEINPNRIRDGNNIYNSTVNELKEALNKIIDLLLRDGIEIDLSEAKVKTIEINTTFRTNFVDLTEVLLLIGRANYKNSIGIYSFNDSNTHSTIKVERSLYINSKMNDYKKDITGKTIKFYDKTFELKSNHNIFLDDNLTRVEVLAGRDFYRNQVIKYNLTNSLADLKDDVLKDIFINSLENEVLTKPSKYLKVIKSNLIYEFFNFKRNEKIKRTERERLKKLSKEVPENYKETRGVLSYLDEKSWIFDYSFLQELVLKEVDSKHKSIYYKQIEKKYLNINNKYVYEKLLKSIFLR
ncbi:MAG: hypothetical protein RR795_02850 [Cetobacterium sp.]|uniref:hypothetical protein n=1 Tax=Cetobacterium sp. TaxID=2071632 RepID=UPI002FC5FA84